MKGLDEIAQKKSEFVRRSCGTMPNTMRIGVGVASAMAESLAMLGHGHLDSEGNKLTDDADIFRDLCLSGGEVMGLRFKVDCKEPAEFIELTWQDRPSFFQYSQAGIPIGDYDTALRRQRDEATVAANPDRFPLSMQSEGVRLGVAIKRIQVLERDRDELSKALAEARGEVLLHQEARTHAANKIAEETVQRIARDTFHVRRIADLELERDHLRDQILDQRSPARVVDNMLGVVDTLEDVSRLNWLCSRLVDNRGTPATQVILGVTEEKFSEYARKVLLPDPIGTSYSDVVKHIIDEKRKEKK